MSLMELSGTLPFPLEHQGGLCRHESIALTATENDDETSYSSRGDDSSSISTPPFLEEEESQLQNRAEEARDEMAECSSKLVRDRIAFTLVQIRHYGITIGDHPLTNLYPLTLDWSYDPTDEILSVDEYERNRDDRPHRDTIPASRGIKAPRLSVNDRIERLVDVTGMTGRELFALERKRQAIAHEESAVWRANQGKVAC